VETYICSLELLGLLVVEMIHYHPSLVMLSQVANHHMVSEAFGRGIFEFKTNITPQEFPL